MQTVAQNTEKRRMLAGEPYDGFDAELLFERRRARRLTQLYNLTGAEEGTRRAELLQELFGRTGENVWIEPPFFCDYGSNIFLGRGVFMNFNCVILDCHEVHIGDGTLFGPAVQIYAAFHSTDPEERKAGRELAAPVSIGRNVWIGGGAIICAGVNIGDDATIGAGSVVVRDLPARVVAAGNPARVLRQIAVKTRQ